MSPTASPSEPPVLVLGAGVSGLTTALCLHERGHEVEIWAREPTLETTSAVAAALWFPYLAIPEEKVSDWSVRSYRRFRELRDEPGAGIFWRPGRWLSMGEIDPPSWASEVEAFERLPPHRVPEPWATGFAFRAPIVETGIYLPYLLGRVDGAGIRVERREVTDLEALRAERPRIVNCTGLGARDLVDDRSLEPVRGQVVRVTGVEIGEFLQADENPEGMTYVVPRSRDVVVGGTADPGLEDLEPDPEATSGMLDRATRYFPALRHATVESVGIGLRPCRSEVRVEREATSHGVVVHDYGHGGAGITLSWGCAEEAARLLEDP